MRDFYFESVLLWTENICVPVNRVCACLKCAYMIFAGGGGGGESQTTDQTFYFSDSWIWTILYIHIHMLFFIS